MALAVMMERTTLAERNADHCLLGSCRRLGNGFRHFARLAVTEADPALAVANDDELTAKSVKAGSVTGAREVGLLVARRAQEKGLSAVVFDRGGFLYHGRVKALADAAREAGLEF